MFICGCRAVTDHEVEAAVDAGARTAAEVALACGAGSRCGNCRELVDAVLAARQTPVLVRSA